MWSANGNNDFFILQNLTTCFDPYGPSSGDNYRNDIQYVLFRRFSFYCNTSIIFRTMRLIYCFLIYIYTILRKFIERKHFICISCASYVKSCIFKKKTPWSESARANYTDRVTASCRRSDCLLLRIEGCHVVSVTDPNGRILGFLDKSLYFSIK
jgi:hypothetical protein